MLLKNKRYNQKLDKLSEYFVINTNGEIAGNQNQQ